MEWANSPLVDGEGSTLYHNNGHHSNFAPHEAAVTVIHETIPDLFGPRAPGYLDSNELWHLFFYQWASMPCCEAPEQAPNEEGTNRNEGHRELLTLWKRTMNTSASWHIPKEGTQTKPRHFIFSSKFSAHLIVWKGSIAGTRMK